MSGLATGFPRLTGAVHHVDILFVLRTPNYLTWSCESAPHFLTRPTTNVKADFFSVAIAYLYSSFKHFLTREAASNIPERSGREG